MTNVKVGDHVIPLYTAGESARRAGRNINSRQMVSLTRCSTENRVQGMQVLQVGQDQPLWSR